VEVVVSTVVTKPTGAGWRWQTVEARNPHVLVLISSDERRLWHRISSAQ
jgi:hypothetical protein